jgi:hypothetical protein
VERVEIKVEFIPSIEMVADPMTKRLPMDNLGRNVVAMELRNT